MNTNLLLRAAVAAIGTSSLVLIAPGCGDAADPDSGEHAESQANPLGSALCLSAASGAYCGNDSMSGATAGTLYQCPGANQAPTSLQVCANGCVVAPAGDPDYCASGPLCLSSAPGAYCGNDSMSGATAGTLYQCPGANQAPTSSQACAGGCNVAPAGYPDTCNSSSSSSTSSSGTSTSSGGSSSDTYMLPWRPGVSMSLTQDCDDACCNDHVGTDAYAWDFADGGSFDVLAARGGTVTHVKINSTSGCGSLSCENEANFIVVDHGDGTQLTYLHLEGFTLDPSVSCGAAVQQGQRLAASGSTGWATGTHLHYQVGSVQPGTPTCECGADGQGCAADAVPWADFWSNATYPSLPVSFVEWPASSSCDNRRITLPASQN